jgi:hypothetical protein
LLLVALTVMRKRKYIPPFALQHPEYIVHHLQSPITLVTQKGDTIFLNRILV